MKRNYIKIPKNIPELELPSSSTDELASNSKLHKKPRIDLNVPSVFNLNESRQSDSMMDFYKQDNSTFTEVNNLEIKNVDASTILNNIWKLMDTFFNGLSKTPERIQSFRHIINSILENTIRGFKINIDNIDFALQKQKNVSNSDLEGFLTEISELNIQSSSPSNRPLKLRQPVNENNLVNPWKIRYRIIERKYELMEKKYMKMQSILRDMENNLKEAQR